MQKKVRKQLGSFGRRHASSKVGAAARSLSSQLLQRIPPESRGLVSWCLPASCWAALSIPSSSPGPSYSHIPQCLKRFQENFKRKFALESWGFPIFWTVSRSWSPWCESCLIPRRNLTCFLFSGGSDGSPSYKETQTTFYFFPRINPDLTQNLNPQLDQCESKSPSATQLVRREGKLDDTLKITTTWWGPQRVGSIKTKHEFSKMMFLKEKSRWIKITLEQSIKLK